MALGDETNTGQAPPVATASPCFVSLNTPRARFLRFLVTRRTRSRWVLPRLYLGLARQQMVSNMDDARDTFKYLQVGGVLAAARHILVRVGRVWVSVQGEEKALKILEKGIASGAVLEGLCILEDMKAAIEQGRFGVSTRRGAEEGGATTTRRVRRARRRRREGNNARCGNDTRAPTKSPRRYRPSTRADRRRRARTSGTIPCLYPRRHRSRRRRRARGTDRRGQLWGVRATTKTRPRRRGSSSNGRGSTRRSTARRRRRTMTSPWKFARRNRRRAPFRLRRGTDRR